MDGFADSVKLFHQRLVDVQAARRIQNHHVALMLTGVFNRFLRRLDRILRSVFIDRHADLTADDLQLLDGRRTIDIAADKQRLLAVLFQPVCQLGGHRRLARALQAAEHEYRNRRRAVLQPRVRAAHQLRQLFVDDLNDLLLGAQPVLRFLPDAALGGLLHKVLDDLVVDVRFQQSHAHFAHHQLDVFLGQAALAAHLAERLLQAAGSILQRPSYSSSCESSRIRISSCAPRLLALRAFQSVQASPQVPASCFDIASADQAAFHMPPADALRGEPRRKPLVWKCPLARRFPTGKNPRCNIRQAAFAAAR